MLWMLAIAACGGDEEPPPEEDPTCDHGDVNLDFGFRGLDLDPGPTSVHQLDATVKLTASAPVSMTCVLDDDPTEVHTVDSEQALCHDLTLHGLLADSDHTCTLTSLDVSEEVAFRTEPLPAWVPEVVAELDDPDRRTGVWTLVNHLYKTAEPRYSQLLVLDPEARVRWSHLVEGDWAGDLDSQYLGDGRFAYGGAAGLPLTLVQLNDAIEWIGPEPSTGGKPHHHVELLDDGDVLMLSQASNSDDRGTFTGFAIERVDLYAGTVRWTVDSQGLVDAGELGRPDDDKDPWHANSLVLVDDGAGVLVSLYEIGLVLHLDTATGELLGSLGAGGSYGLRSPAGNVLPDDAWFDASHGLEWHDGRLLLYDNGRAPPAGLGSRILELQLNRELGVAVSTWSWTESGWEEPIWGDVDELEGGNLLITRGHCSDCSTANPDSVSDIIELDRETEEIVWRISFEDSDSGIYRAERIEGCALFVNARYCP